MITYGHLGGIYPHKKYYVLTNYKKEIICYIPVERKKEHESLITKLGFDLRLGKEFM